MTKAKDWETRLYHEGMLHEHSSFLTLTFSDEHLPPDLSVSVRDLQLFMKRFRKRVDQPLRFFACGEYGDTQFRPHYHLVVFGYEFPDRTPWRKTGSGHVTYRSEMLEALWPYGHCEIGSVTPASSGYVARYVLKKVNGEAAEERYTRVHPWTGEVLRVRPEFICMSTRPGIGAGWYERYGADAFPSDFVVVDGTRRQVPRYYAKKLEKENAEQLLEIKQKRQERAEKHADNNTPERLATREEVTELRVKQLKREMENDT